MSVQPPPPPSISPAQMTLLRIAATMAWSDGHLADEEVEVMLDQFSHLFAQGEVHRESLRAELRDYLMQNIPLNELVPRITDPAEKELVLTLGYQVINASARTPDEARVNAEEADAYQQLITLLGLPADTVQRIEQDNAVSESENLVEQLTSTLQDFWSE
jgi:hypothetical protein